MSISGSGLPWETLDEATSIAYFLCLVRKDVGAMTDGERERLIRQYAAGETTWRSLQEHGFQDYVQVLGALGEFGLRPPTTTGAGPNREARDRGVSMLREALRRLR